MKSFFCTLFFFLCSSPSSEAAPLIKLVPWITEGLEAPVYVLPDSSNPSRYFILEQTGKILTVTNGQLDAKSYLDISSQVEYGGEMGLLGLALHPDFSNNGRYFVNYTTRRSGLKTIISEFSSARAGERTLMQFTQPYSNHNGGHLAFDKAGYLYIATGDGGSAGDPHANGQKLDTLLGKVLRIDVNSGTPYGIPKDNPFLTKGRGEVYAYGLRNPWRFSFDTVTGALLAGDVGQDKYEEVDLIEKGGNYGWRTMEGMHCFKPASGCDQTGLILPLVEYPRRDGVSITGGYVYRGNKIPELKGVYVYGDFGSGKVWGLTYDFTTKKVVKNELLLNSKLPISSFGEDRDGELFLVSYDGRIFRIAAP
jgi:glucose/arabinose dehydrogenase